MDRSGNESEPRSTRRQFVAGAAALGAGVLGGAALTPTLAFANTTESASTTTTQPRIDVHHHFVLPGYTAAGGTYPGFKTWTPQISLDDMDDGGVQMAVLSVTNQVLEVFATNGDAFAPDLIRQSNEYGAQLVADHPDRFGLFAALPLTDTDASLDEIEYALDTLHADGIGLFTSYGQQWLGDSAFDPVFAELDRRHAVVYTHPVAPFFTTSLVAGVTNPALIEYQTDTSRAIAGMIFGGASQRFPNLRMIFSHGAGTVPYLIRRFTAEATTPALAPVLPHGFMPEFARFYHDIAQVAARSPLLSLHEAVQADRLLFGTDFPYLTAVQHVTGLQAANVYTATELAQIDSAALRLLPQLATR